MERFVFFSYLFIIVISPLLFGAVHTYAYTLMSIVVLIGSMIILKNNIQKNDDTDEYFLKIPACGVYFLFLSILILLFFQITPLPDFILDYISPNSLMIKEKSIPLSRISPIPAKWTTIVSYLYPVKMSLVRWTVYGLFFMGLTQLLNSKKRIEIILFAILITASFDALYGIIQTYSGSYHIWWYKSETGSNLTGTYINRNHFGGFMGMSFLLTAGYAAAVSSEKKQTRKTQKRKTLRAKLIDLLSIEHQFNKTNFIMFMGVVIGIGLILSASRGAILSASLSMFFLSLIFISRKNSKRSGFIIFLLFLITSIYSLNIGIDHTIDRFKFLDVDYEIRSRFAKKLLEVFEDYPIIGIGIGNFQYVYPKYQAIEDKKKYLEFVHNDWMQYLAESGIIGIVFFLIGIALYLYLFFKIWRQRRDPFAISIGASSIAVLIDIGIHSYSDFNLHMPANFLLITAITSIGFSVISLKKRTNYKIPLKYVGSILLILIFSLIFWTLSLSVKHFMAEINCPTVPNSTFNLDLAPPYEKIKKAIEWDKNNAEYWFKLAENIIKIRDKKSEEDRNENMQMEIIRFLEEAIKLNPLESEYHTLLAWEYTRLWKKPDYHKKWLPLADISMERAAFFAGLKNSYVHLEMANYWVMRSKTLTPADNRWEPAWNRACWHYRKLFELEDAEHVVIKLKKQIKDYIWNFYPDNYFVNQVIQ